MPRRSSNTLSLVRKRIRPSFNKTNIYNTVTWEKNANRNTQYRQVFFAKQETRSYHGEHLTETQFRNIFKPENSSVSPLQKKRHDSQGEVPHAMQTFTALERRLDFAVFRSLFASSVRQAAQFVVGGAVKVNGVKISSPSYQLQAGDVFSVDSNRVLEALGRSKPSIAQSVEITNRIIRKYNKHLDRCRANPEKMYALRDRFRHRHHVHNQKYLSMKQRRADSHNSALKAELNNKFLELKPQPVLARVLSGALATESNIISDKIRQVINLVRGEGLSVEAAGNPTTAEQDVDADNSPVDPLPESKKASSENAPETMSQQDVDADNSPVDPLAEHKKASNENAPETTSQQDVDADNSPVDPLPEHKKASSENAPETTSQQDVDADNSPVDPLPEHKKASSENAPETMSQQDVDADNSPVDPLAEHKKASNENAPETMSQQDVDADNSPVDPLPESKKASNENAPETTSQQDVDADNSPIDPLPESKKASNENAPETASQQDVDADNSPIDPLPESKKASSENAPETASEQDVDADNSPVDPLPDAKKASHEAFNSTAAADIASKYVEDKAFPGTRKNVLRLVDEIIKDHRLELREKYHAKMIDANAPAPYDPEWVKRLPENAQEVATDMSEEDLANLKIALPWSTTGKLYGLADPSKRWFTPWTPRQFIAPMAVLPHHIEVDFETCNAVYLRDPVARPNHSEVISPFSLEMHERAYMWYFYRRRKNLSRL